MRDPVHARYRNRSPATAPPEPPQSPAAAELAGQAAQLRLAVARLHRRARQEAIGRDDDVSPSRLAALATIEKRGPITLGALAAEEQVQPPSMTRIVTRLEEQGLVTREVDPSDRRHVARMRITPTGAALLARNRTPRQRLPRRAPRPLHRRRAATRSVAALPLLERILEDD